jgi:DNA-binding CsgD family transcriptional regulator
MGSDAMNHDGRSSLQSYLSDEAWALLAQRLDLSPREVQIICRIFAHEREAEIARALEMSSHTVRTHMERLYRKLQVRSRTELVIAVVGCLLAEIAQPDACLPPICGQRSAGRCPFDR